MHAHAPLSSVRPRASREWRAAARHSQLEPMAIWSSTRVSLAETASGSTQCLQSTVFSRLTIPQTCSTWWCNGSATSRRSALSHLAPTANLHALPAQTCTTHCDRRVLCQAEGSTSARVQADSTAKMSFARSIRVGEGFELCGGKHRCK